MSLDRKSLTCNFFLISFWIIKELFLRPLKHYQSNWNTHSNITKPDNYSKNNNINTLRGLIENFTTTSNNIIIQDYQQKQVYKLTQFFESHSYIGLRCLIKTIFTRLLKYSTCSCHIRSWGTVQIPKSKIVVRFDPYLQFRSCTVSNVTR